MCKTVIVTGASRGIGACITKTFALNGYNVLINYRNSKNKAMELKNELEEKNCNVDVYCADVSSRADTDSMVAFCLDRFGGADILINNAAIAQTKLFTDITEDDWNSMIDINLKGVFNCCQSVLREMINKKRGKIINISSIWGMVGASCEVHYSAAKAGVIGLTKALAKELAPSKIQVNCIAPGIIKTDMLDNLSEDELHQLETDTPAGRLGTPNDIADCALFLADKKSNFITGQIISPNGGYVI